MRLHVRRISTAPLGISVLRNSPDKKELPSSLLVRKRQSGFRSNVPDPCLLFAPPRPAKPEHAPHRQFCSLRILLRARGASRRPDDSAQTASATAGNNCVHNMAERLVGEWTLQGLLSNCCIAEQFSPKFQEATFRSPRRTRCTPRPDSLWYVTHGGGNFPIVSSTGKIGSVDGFSEKQPNFRDNRREALDGDTSSSTPRLLNPSRPGALFTFFIFSPVPWNLVRRRYVQTSHQRGQ